MRGGDSAGLRAFNEKLIISEILKAGALSKADIARATGLSGQAASVIVNRLLEDGLLVKRDKVRGQVGQPSTPIAANPEGALSLGVKIGRRSVDAIIVNMLGDIVDRRSRRYEAPYPDATMAAAKRLSAHLLDALPPAHRQRVVGLGIAMPGDLHAWSAELGLDPGVLDGWRGIDPASVLSELTGLPAELYNDATAACAAEMIAGDGISRQSAFYVYLGTFVGGGIVLDGKLYRGAQRNAGAIGSMPTCSLQATGGPAQLIHAASVISLERALDADGLDSQAALAGDEVPGAAEAFQRWAEDAVPAVARAVVSALGVIDFETVVVDGLLPPAWRRDFVRRLRGGIRHFDLTGLSPANVVIGSIGPMARVLGAALLPLRARFSPDTELLVRSGGQNAAPLDGTSREEAS